MKRILFFLLAVIGLQQANAQTNIYNPDADDDGFISTEDLLTFLTYFDSDFTPNPCNCGCYANPFYEPYAVEDTLTGYEVASNLFLAQPDSIRFDFVIAPYGTGWMPFSDVDSLQYDTSTFSQTYPFNYVDLNGGNAPCNLSCGYSSSCAYSSGYGSDIPYMSYRDHDHQDWRYQVAHDCVNGGLDIFDGYSSVYSMRIKANDICPNLLNDEIWNLYNDVQYFQVDEGVYVNVFEFASSNVPTEPSAEYPASWTMHYPLNWLVITEIHNTPEGTE